MMPLFRTEIHKTVVRLRLIRNELLESDFPKTAAILDKAILSLENTDNTYIVELANKKHPGPGK